MKEEALKLADELDALHQYVPSEAPAMIRRLVEELDNETRKAKAFRQSNQVADTQIKALIELTKPLSDDVLFEILKSLPYSDAVRLPEGFRLFARAIEERHGIK